MSTPEKKDDSHTHLKRKQKRLLGTDANDFIEQERRREDAVIDQLSNPLQLPPHLQERVNALKNNPPEPKKPKRG